MATLYKIKDWSENYEISQTKKASFSKFVPLPNKLDGDGYTELVDHPNGAAHYGAWVTMVSIASKCDPKGTLVRDSGKPHDASTLSRITRIPASVFAEVLPRLVSIGWMETEGAIGSTTCDEVGAQWEQSGSVLPVCSNAVDYKTIQDSTEQYSTRQDITEPPLPPDGGSRPAEVGSADIRAVFEHYRTYHPRAFQNPLASSKEWRLVRDRIKEGSTVEDLKTAIDGCHVCPHNCGINDKNQKYQGLHIIVRDGGQVARFIDEWNSRDGPVLSQKTQMSNRAAQNYLAKKGFGNVE